MDALNQISQHILAQIDDHDRVVLAPCYEVDHETWRCFPKEAQFWTIYIDGTALEDIVSVEATVAVLAALWDERHIDIDFDFGTDGYSASSITSALHQTHLLVSAPSDETEALELDTRIAPLRDALHLANSNHGRMRLAARLRGRADILCFPDRANIGEPMPLDTRFITLSGSSDTLVAAWLPEAPQRLLVAIKSWDNGASRLLSITEARELADAIEQGRHISFKQAEDKVDMSATRTNRGEPYRDGTEVYIDGHSIFLEEGYECELFIKLLRQA